MVEHLMHPPSYSPHGHQGHSHEQWYHAVPLDPSDPNSPMVTSQFHSHCHHSEPLKVQNQIDMLTAKVQSLQRQLEEQKQSEAPKIGSILHMEDTNEVAMWDGTQWVPLSKPKEGRTDLDYFNDKLTRALERGLPKEYTDQIEAQIKVLQQCQYEYAMAGIE